MSTLEALTADLNLAPVPAEPAPPSVKPAQEEGNAETENPFGLLLHSLAPEEPEAELDERDAASEEGTGEAEGALELPIASAELPSAPTGTAPALPGSGQVRDPASDTRIEPEAGGERGEPNVRPRGLVDGGAAPRSQALYSVEPGLSRNEGSSEAAREPTSTSERSQGTDPHGSGSSRTNPESFGEPHSGNSNLQGVPTQAGAATTAAAEGVGFDAQLARADQTLAPETRPASSPSRALPELPPQNEAEILQGARVLVREGGGSARIQLTPPQLGGLEIEIRIRDGAVQVQLLADRSAVADLIQHHMPSLRHVLQAQGLNVDQIEVGSRDVDDSRQGPRFNDRFGGADGWNHTGGGDGRPGRESGHAGLPAGMVRDPNGQGLRSLGTVDLRA